MALHIFVVRDLMADWGWGFTCPQPLPNPLLRRAKCNFQLAIQKKETEVSPRLTNFVLRYVLSINLAAKKTTSALQARTVRTITTDNGSEFCCHKMISKALAPKGTPLPPI